MAAGGEQQAVIGKLLVVFSADSLLLRVRFNDPGAGYQFNPFFRVPAGFPGNEVLFLQGAADILVQPYPVVKRQFLVG